MSVTTEAKTRPATKRATMLTYCFVFPPKCDAHGKNHSGVTVRDSPSR